MSLNQFLFSPRGRIGLLPFWLWAFSVAGVVMFIGLLDITLGNFVPVEINHIEIQLPIFSMIIEFLFIVPTGIMVLIKRSHDRGHSGLFLLLLLVPVLFVWPMIELYLVAGTNGPNQYGPGPRQSKISNNSID